MPATGHTVSTGFNPRLRTAAAVVAFLAMASAVYFIAARDAGQQTETSAVAVRLCFPGKVAWRSAPLRFAEVEQLLESDAYLGEAARRAGLATASSDDVHQRQLRQQLSVSLARSTAGNEWELSLVMEHADPERRVALLNYLARRFADEQRAYWDKTARQPYLAAHAALERARDDVFRAKGDLERFLDDDVSRRMAAPVAQAPPATAAVPRQAPPGALDPRRLALEEERAELIQHRNQLLVDRMPAHPAVQDVTNEIARINTALASLPPAPAVPPTQPPIQRPQPPAPRIHPGDVPLLVGPMAGQFERLKLALDESGRQYDRAAEAERAAWQQQLTMPQIELELAEPHVALAPNSPRLFVLALVSAMSMALGVGLVGTGLGIDPPVESVEEVECRLGLPVVGSISRMRRGKRPRTFSPGRKTLIAYGGILVVACLTVLYLMLQSA